MKEERRKIETSNRESKRNLEPKIGKILFRMSLLEQTPSFATDKNFVTMNPQWCYVLRRPGSQDLRRMRVYKTCSGKSYNPMNIQMYTNSLKKGECFGNFYSVISTLGEFSSRPEAWSPSLPSSLLQLEPSSPESLESSSSVEDSGDAVPFPRFSSSII
jgi:hypothetical protein